MKTAIMQPYIFPYIGYFQLIFAVDQFVIYDDVNFIKGGWINRNRYLLDGQAKFFTFSLENASSFKRINETFILDNENFKTKEKILKTITMAYSKAPYFESVYNLLKPIILNEENNLARYVEHSIRHICKYIGIDTKILTSSKLPKKTSMRGQDKVIDICLNLSTSIYINPIGGKSLYKHEDFNANGMELQFLKTNPDLKYKQFVSAFVPGLSIIDVMMFNTTSNILDFLDKYTLEK